MSNYYPSETTPLVGDGQSHLLDSRGNTWKDALFNSHYTPGLRSDKAIVRVPAQVLHTFKMSLYSNYVNFLLIMVPLGLIAGKLEWDPTLVFTLNFFAIIPLAAVLSFATEEISLRLGETLGGLLNATFGNAVELIVSIIALRNGQVKVVQSSMLGSILSNLLLVLGMCFVAGGWFNLYDAHGRGQEQTFSDATAQTTCSLMTLSSASLVIPATLYWVLSGSDSTAMSETSHAVLFLSRGTAIILLVMYVLYLVFQLRTHRNLFEPEQGDSFEDEGHEEPRLSTMAAGLVLLITTLFVSFCADYLVDSIDPLVEKSHISKSFIGLILIPIVGNAAEHVTAVVVAARNKMDLAMGVAIGSSIQIALLVTPFLVIFGWVIGVNMTLNFDIFETIAFAFSVLIVSYTVQDGKSNWLEGMMLLGLYLIIAMAFYFTPQQISLGPVLNMLS